jgi:DNA-directed RNA polymerase specialized sigma24 family protein
MPQVVEPRGLVARAKAGDGSACHALFEAHAKRIYFLSLRLAGESLDAETLTRDIFLAAFAKLNSIPDDDAFAVELYRQSAKTVLARYFRRGVTDPGGAASQPQPASE